MGTPLFLFLSLPLSSFSSFFLLLVLTHQIPKNGSFNLPLFSFIKFYSFLHKGLTPFFLFLPWDMTCMCVCVCVCARACARAFLGLHLCHIEVPRLGVKSELYPLAYTTGHRNTRSLAHWARPRIEPVSLWMLVRFVSACATTGTQGHDFLNYLNGVFSSFSNYCLLMFRKTINFCIDFVSTAQFGYKLMTYS